MSNGLSSRQLPMYRTPGLAAGDPPLTYAFNCKHIA